MNLETDDYTLYDDFTIGGFIIRKFWVFFRRSSESIRTITNFMFLIKIKIDTQSGLLFEFTHITYLLI